MNGNARRADILGCRRRPEIMETRPRVGIYRVRLRVGNFGREKKNRPQKRTIGKRRRRRRPVTPIVSTVDTFFRRVSKEYRKYNIRYIFSFVRCLPPSFSNGFIEKFQMISQFSGTHTV